MRIYLTQGLLSAFSCRDSLRDFSDEKPHQLIFVDPAKHDSNSRSFRTEYTRSRRWRVPSSTHSAARKAADRLIGTNPQHSIVAREQEYEELVQSLRKSGKIGTQRRTSGKRQRTVQDLPKLQVSSNLIHAAQIGIREASHGYQLTGGVKPKNKLGNEHLDVLKRMRGGSIKGSIWQ